ncbi:hypothetical protein HDU81_001266 [Chytriomyces hyalinus]|nr:hypothetical protein HDU81_001266 [Chytriomyces hyalinus]
MQSYAPEYILQHTPLLGVSGLESAEASTEKQLVDALFSRNSASLFDPQINANANTATQRVLFHAVHIETLPPTKAASPSLSPRRAHSPLFPDGMMSPLWLLRHRALLPAVVAMFKRLPASQDLDTNLCMQVNNLRRLSQERGIKFALILILDAIPSGNPLLEDRIVAVRRACSLDSKNSLFVMPPTSGAPLEVQDFVHGLQRHLFENAVNYYREHGRRVKKKKAKLGPLNVKSHDVVTPLVSHPNLIDISNDSSSAKPLHPMGWSVRYDYKMAVFAEFRQDLETATRHYEDAYQTLLNMFHSTLGVGNFSSGNGAELIAPYSARWTEAKTLADCISIKICKLSLYSDAPLPALQQHQRHISNFKWLPEFAGELNGSMASLLIPGLRNYAASVPGNGSYEYWSWVSRHCRVFGELIEIAVSKIGLKVPFPAPGASLSSPVAGGTFVSTGLEAPLPAFGPASATITNNVVQHAGHYYYLAAACAEERWNRFKIADEIARKFAAAVLSNSARGRSEQQALASERQIDHSTSAIELLTKSYEQFKRHKSGRMTLFLAAEIARMYQQAGKHDMALKFFERISKTYRKENWPFVLRGLLEMCSESAKRAGKWEVVVECLVELCCARVTTDSTLRETFWSNVLAILNGDRNASNNVVNLVDVSPSVEMLSIHLDMDRMNSFLECDVQFMEPHAHVGDPVRFQVTIGSDIVGGVAAFRASRICVRFSNGQLDTIWMDSEVAGPATSEKAVFVDGTNTTRQVDPDATDDTLEGASKENRVFVGAADLGIVPGVKKVFEGQIIPRKGEELKILAVNVILESTAARLGLTYNVGDRPSGVHIARRRWLLNDAKPRYKPLKGYGELSSVKITDRLPSLHISLLHEPPVLLDEVYPIAVQIENNDAQDVEGIIDIDFKNSTSSEAFDMTSQISQDSAELLKPIELSVTPANSSTASINLLDDASSAMLKKTTADSSSNHALAVSHGLSYIHFGTLQAKSKKTIQVFVRALKHCTDRSLHVRVSFNAMRSSATADDSDDPSHLENGTDEQESQYRFHKVDIVRISCVRAFEATFVPQPRALPMLFPHTADESSTLFNGADGGTRWKFEAGLFSMAEESSSGEFRKRSGWTVIGNVKANAPCDILVENVAWTPPAVKEGLQVDVKSIAFGEDGAQLCLNNGNSRNYVLHAEIISNGFEALTDVMSSGGLKLKWKRVSADNWCESVLKIPELDLSYPDVWTYIELPGEARVGKPFSLSYRIQNSSMMMQELDMQIEPSDAFVFSGCKVLHQMHLLPFSERSIRFVVVPLAAGVCKLPKMKVTRQVVRMFEGDEPAGTGGGGGGLVEEVIPTFIAGGGASDDFVVYVWPKGSR